MTQIERLQAMLEEFIRRTSSKTASVKISSKRRRKDDKILYRVGGNCWHPTIAEAMEEYLVRCGQ